MGSDGFGCVQWDGSAKGDTVKRVRRTHITTVDTIVYADMEGWPQVSVSTNTQKKRDKNTTTNHEKIIRSRGINYRQQPKKKRTETDKKQVRTAGFL